VRYTGLLLGDSDRGRVAAPLFPVHDTEELASHQVDSFVRVLRTEECLDVGYVEHASSNSSVLRTRIEIALDWWH
jgi:hypothetical protein